MRNDGKIIDEIRQKIFSMYQQDANGIKIARQLNISKSVVYKILALKKKTNKKWTDHEIEYVANARLKGHSYKYIAKYLKRSVRAVMIASCRRKKCVLKDKKKVAFFKMLMVCKKYGLTANKALLACKKADILKEAHNV